MMMLVSMVALAGPALADGANLVPNGGFEEELSVWKTWGPDAAGVVRDEDVAHAGAASLRLPPGKGSAYTYLPLAGGTAYEVRGAYRCEGGGLGGSIRFALCARDKGNGSAGTRLVPLPPGRPGEWVGVSHVIVTSSETVQSQFVLSTDGSVVHLDGLAVAQTDMPEWADPGAGAWDGITAARTESPVFEEVLSEQAGGYRVSMWSHALIKASVPEPERGSMSDSEWKRATTETFRAMGESGLGALLLPWGVMGADKPENFWRTDQFLTELHAEHGLTFDAAAESSAVTARAVNLGAEVLNRAEVEGGARPRISLVDPAYTRACLEELQSLGEILADRPYVRAVMGKDEPSIVVHPRTRAEAGEVLQAADEEVRDEYGYGRYGMPAPADPDWQAKPEEQPLSWIAFHRWAGAEYADQARDKQALAKRLNRDWAYIPCDHWLMSGHVPFDFSRMAKYSDIVEGDPYASSAERTRGRGMYNHGFGAKLLADLSRGGQGSDPKPVEIIVQAFDYAGYEMTPQDLLEWCSQALRSGATSLCYYASDNPRFTDEPRWGMMTHISKTVTEMKALERPTKTKTAILYCSTAHMAEGASSSADEVYTAYAFLGERLGCWFDIISDRQLRRGLRELDDYNIIYLPLAKYAEPGLLDDLRAWVEAGGTLVCADPDAFTTAPDGSDLSEAREGLLGVKVGGPLEEHAVTVGSERVRIFPRRGSTGREFTARSVETGSDCEARADYLGGEPAVVEHALGEGKTVYFAANPFTPASLLDGESWEGFLKALQEEAGEAMGLPIWRFRLPPVKPSR